MLSPAGATILPLLSQAQPRLVLPDDKAKALMTRIQNAGTEVVEAKVCPHSASCCKSRCMQQFVSGADGEGN